MRALEIHDVARATSRIACALEMRSSNGRERPKVWKLSESIGVKTKSWIAKSDVLFRDVRVPQRQPSLKRLQAVVGENQNASAAGPPSKPQDYHRVNIFFTSPDKILAEIGNQFK